MSNWQRLDTKIAYQNSDLTVHEDSVITPDGRSAKYGWIETSPSVVIVAVNEDDKVLLVKRLRYTTGQPSWELPGGGTDGQDALDAGKRELLGEAGLHADKWVALSGEYHVWSSFATQRNTVLIARSLHKAKGGHSQTDDVINPVQAYSWKELMEMVKNGELNESETVTALMLAGLNLGYIK